jgi:hypothetical protein
MRRTWLWGICTAVAAVVALAGAAVAIAAATGVYKGKTAQKQAVSLKLSAGQVTSFKIVLLDKCPDGHILRVTGRYPPMKVSNGRFGGAFVPVGGAKGERATLSGTVGATKVTGSLKDASLSHKEGRICHGTTKFSAKHR